MSRRAIRGGWRGLLLVAALLVAGACAGDDTADSTAPAGSDVTSPTTGADTTTSDPGQSPAPELAGTSWKVTDYSLGASITNVWPDTEITLRFGTDGTVAGSTGCNEYNATFEVDGPYDEFEPGVRDANDGQAIRIGSLTVTERACTPDRIMEQEAEFLDLLRGAGRWLIARGNLNLRTGDGAFLFEAEPAG